MTIRLSTQTRNNLVGPKGVGATFANGIIEVRSGTQPATADAAATGTILGVLTMSSGAFTPETRASQTITLTGSAGSINTVNVGTTGPVNIIPLGAVNFITDLTTTAVALRDAIIRAGLYHATAAGAVVTVIAPSGTGDAQNGLALSTTVTTMAATSGGNMAGGVDAVNGLTFAAPAAGVLSKSGVWSFNGIAAGTAGWFRLKASALDSDALSDTLARIDGSVAVSGADMNLSNITIAVSTPVTVDTFTITMPAS